MASQAFGNTYVELLTTEGYRPKLEADDETVDILFKSEGLQYRLLLYLDDPEFYSLSLCYGVEDEGVAMEQLLASANAANERWKVVKVTVHPAGEAARFQYEGFGQLSPGHLQRALGILRTASDSFFGDIRSHAQPKAQA